MTMTVLGAAMTHIRHNIGLVRAVGLDPDELIKKMRDTAALYDDTFACSETARTLYAEAKYMEDNAHEEFGAGQRAIARMLRTVAHNLNAHIPSGAKPRPVE